MNFKFLFTAAASVLFLSACSDDSSSGAGDEIPMSSSSDDLLVLSSSDMQVVPSGVSITMPTGPGLLVDDFEDGNNENFLNDYWYTYDDASNNAKSVITTPVDAEGYMIPGPANNGTNYALVVHYTLDKGDYQYDPYVGWGTQVMRDTDNARFGGITYWYIGGAHEVHIETSDVKDYDVHFAKVKASRVWTQAVIRFKDLAQGGWGKEVEFNAENISAISFQAKGDGVVDSVIIDNIYLQDTSEVEKDKADLTINPPEIPEVAYTPEEITVTSPLQEKAMKYLDKGVSFTNWLEEANGKFKTFKLGEADVKVLADNGVKSIRLPIDLDLYANNRDAFVDSTDTTNVLEFDDVALFTVLDSFANWTERYGVSFVIDYHEYDNSYNKTSASNPRYIAMMSEVWKHVANHFAENPREDIFFELLNEPDMTYGKVTADQWTLAAQSIIDSIRTVDSTHTLLFGDAQWYSITLLAKRTPFTDPNIVYVIHTYEPFVFTHQGASWTDYGTIRNLPFPYDPALWSEYSADFGVSKSTKSNVRNDVRNYYKNGSKEAIMKNVLIAKKWAAANNVPVIINEFGALSLRSTAESRLNYLKAMREIGDALQIPLTHWGYTGDFAVIENGKLIEGVGEALGFIDGGAQPETPAAEPETPTAESETPAEKQENPAAQTETPADDSSI